MYAQKPTSDSVLCAGGETACAVPQPYIAYKYFLEAGEVL